MKKKVYIAGPMTGLDCFNFESFFVMARCLRKAGYEVVNPAQRDTERMFDGWVFSLDQYPDILMRDLTMIKDECFCLVQLNGWKDSKGAKVETAFARAIGVKIVSEEEIDKSISDNPFEPIDMIIKSIIGDHL